MIQPLAITSFNFEEDLVDQKALMQAWMLEIEMVARHREPNVVHSTFMIALMRVAVNSNVIGKIDLETVIGMSGYARSTFFRLFKNKHSFMLNMYQQVCSLSIMAYAKYLNERQMNVSDFSKFTIDMWYGSTSCIPTEILQVLWKENTRSHLEFHPFLTQLTPIIFSYLTQNAQTKHLKIDVDELDGVIQTLDLELLHSRLENDRHWGKPVFYKKLKHMLEGYLITCV